MFSGLSGRVVMLMEDEFLIAMDIEDELRACGAEVLGPFARVCDGLKALETAEPCAAVLDVNLADGEVYPIADRLARKAKPIVFSTGMNAPGELIQMFGEVKVCRKPANAKEVVSALEEALRRQAAA